jgi:ABC-type bacteriocin/lantibiotic exporter with double-glycine peptidase domain
MEEIPNRLSYIIPVLKMNVPSLLRNITFYETKKRVSRNIQSHFIHMIQDKPNGFYQNHCPQQIVVITK